MYFDRFPKGSYILPGTKTFKLVSDLFRRVKIRDKIKNEARIYTEYFVSRGERPEHIAQNHFGNPELHWVVLITNNIADALYDWPMSFSAFEEYIKDKYDNAEAIHHYEKVQSSGPQTSIDYSHLIECNSTDPGAQAVSNREYEDRQQDKYRQKKLLNQDLLIVFLKESDSLMNS